MHSDVIIFIFLDFPISTFRAAASTSQRSTSYVWFVDSNDWVYELVLHLLATSGREIEYAIYSYYETVVCMTEFTDKVITDFPFGLTFQFLS